MPEEKISPAVVIIPIGIGLGLTAALGLYALARAAPPEGPAATIKIEVLGAEGHPPVTLLEGESYIVRLTVTNQSTKAGMPVEAVLGVGISAATEWTSLIPIQVSSEYFAPGETRTFDYTMVVPVGAGGETGQITAWVEDPTGLAIASATEDVVIAPAEVPPFSFGNESVYRKTCPTATTWDTPVYDCRISNLADRMVSHHLELWQQSYSHTYNKWYSPRLVNAPGSSIDLTLSPGESYNYHFDGVHPDPEEPGETYCDPGIPLHYTIVYWLQDEAGNRSEGVSIYRP